MRERTGLKILALAGMLGLCLTLAGCYIAPDDINQNDPNPTYGGSLPFQTLAPTATVAVTPDTVVIETQNLYPNQGNWNPQGAIQVTNSGQETPAPMPTPTPAQGSAGWSDWGTVSGVTNTPEPGWTVSEMPPSTPDGGTVILATRTPAPGGASGGAATATPRATIRVVTAAPATPSPTPKSLQRGFTNSEEVRALQKRLKALGWYSGSADGDFGPATEAAVKAFQKANGLTADGKAGQKTLEKLNSKSAISKKQANATATPKATAKTTARPTAKPTARATATSRPTATPNLSKDYYLQLGSSGQKVKTLQNRLIELGWLGGKATGDYDAATEAAVKAFQRRTKGLWDDGVAGPDTLKALYASNAARSGSVAASTGQTLEKGSEGDAVRMLQRKLKDLGYLSGTVDGSYGIATEAAVIAFQQRNGLTPDGKAGTATLNRLYSDDAVKNGGSPVDTSTRTDGNASTGASTSGIASTGYVTLEEGSKGDTVRKLQERLKKLGYYNGSVDGSFGEGTAAAVMAFQLRNNLTVDGKAGPATQRALYGGNAAIS